jgi:hypothetical protein
MALQTEVVAKTANAYFSLGIRRSRLSDGQRGASSDVFAITTLWVETDAAMPYRSSAKRYFPDQEEIITFLRSLPLPPSIIVSSGGGIHAYWLLKEPLVFDADEADYAAALVRGWQSFIRSQTEYEIDYTHDLARVLRVPGTTNRHSEDERPVMVLEVTDRRYNPSDFEQWQDWSQAKVKDVPRDFTVRLGAQPPLEKFLTLSQNDRYFSMAWDEKGNIKDQSPSGYAMRLANIAVQAGWTNQEICDLLVAFRGRKSRENKKGSAWFILTIAKARQGPPPADDQEALAVRMTNTTEPDEKLACLSQMLGFEVLRLVKRRAVDPSGYLTPAWYVIETSVGNIDVPDAETMGSLNKMKLLIFDRLDRLVEIKPKAWPAALKAMLAVMVTEDAPPEASPYEEIRGYLREYIERKGTCEDPMKVHDGGFLLKLDDRLWFSLSRFAEWCRVNKHLRVGPRNLPVMLETIGCERRKIDNLIQEKTGNRTKVIVWSVPR